MRVRNNGAARRSYSSYRTNSGALSKNLEKLSSGYKINRSADDAAGLSVSEKMRAQIAGLKGAQHNAKDGISLIQVTEGALQEYHEIVNRMLELSVKSANATYEDDVDREQLQKEMTRLAQELNRIADSTNFNGVFTLRGDGEELEEDEASLSSGGSGEKVTCSVLDGSKPVNGNDIVYDHYHSRDLTESDKKTGANAQWSFGGYTYTFNADDFTTIEAQIDAFCQAYNSDPVNDHNGWKARVLGGGSSVTLCFLPNQEPDANYPARPNGDGERSPIPLDQGEGLTGLYNYSGGRPTESGSPARTVVNFGTQTGADMLGAVMSLGRNGAYGKYQFVRSASDAKSGYKAIVISPSATASEVARAAYQAMQGDAPSDYTISLSGSTVSFQGKMENGKVQGEGYQALPLSIVQKGSGSGDDEDETAFLFGGDLKDRVRLLIGDTAEKHNFLDVPIVNMHTNRTGLSGVDIRTQTGALQAIDKIKGAINKVSDVRGTYGALQNRLEHTINYLGNARENIQQSESVIRDTDMADEMMKYTKNNILMQSAQSMMAQANTLPQGVLQLIR